MIALLWALATPPSAHAAKAENLWHEWYLVSRNGAPVSTFEETAERRPQDRELSITQRWVEKAAGGLSETYIGSVSAERDLSPVAFFVERKGAKPYKIDGRARVVNDAAGAGRARVVNDAAGAGRAKVVNDAAGAGRAEDKRLEITFKPGTPGLAKSTGSAALGPGTYLSSFLPTAISRRFLGGKESFAFTAVVEDGGDMDVEVKRGTVEVGTAVKTIGKRKCRLAVVNLDGAAQEWWIAKNGLACRVVFPGSGTRMELSTEKAAKKALGGG
jgi:hypothetical protein